MELCQGGMFLPVPARLHSGAGVCCVGCCCEPSTTLDSQGPSLGPQSPCRVPVFSLGDSRTIPPYSLRSQASPLQPFTPTPTFIMENLGDFAENNLIRRWGLVCVTKTQIPLQNNWIPFPSVGFRGLSSPLTTLHRQLWKYPRIKLWENANMQCSRTCYLLNPVVTMRVEVVLQR